MSFDNLRRSLQPTALILLLMAGWFFLPARATLWTLLLVALIGLPFLTGSVDAGFRFLRQLPRRADFEAESQLSGPRYKNASQRIFLKNTESVIKNFNALSDQSKKG
jgi:hypothetical protein